MPRGMRNEGSFQAAQVLVQESFPQVKRRDKKTMCFDAKFIYRMAMTKAHPKNQEGFFFLKKKKV